MNNHTPSLHAPFNYSLAVFLSAGANLILGTSSLYWKALDSVHPVTLVAYRITLSTVILAIGLSIFRQKNQIKQITLTIILLHCVASLFIAINWATFIAASINGYILESGLGYLLAPFISIALGVFVYRDPTSTNKIISVTVAFCLVVILIAFSDSLDHWTYLLIASTWGAYTYIKKLTPLDAINGLFIETFFLTACLALAIVLFEVPVVRPYELPVRSTPLIWLAGAVSLAPLLMFSYSTEKLPLSLTGTLQFILPLTLLTLGLTLYKSKASEASQVLVITSTALILTLLVYDTIKARPSQKD